MKDIEKLQPNELLDMIDNKMASENKKQFEVLRELAIDSRYIGMLRHKLGRQLRVNNSSLFDRVYFCTCISEGIYTAKDVSKITGYSLPTIYKWLKTYKEFGTEMLQRATTMTHIKD